MEAARSKRKEELALVRRIKTGDEEAFTGMMRQFQGKVFALAYGMLRSREDAADVTQETFVKTFRHIGSFRGDSALYTWLYRIAMNLCLDRIRRKDPAALQYDDARGETDENGAAGDGRVILPASVRLMNPGEAALTSELRDRILDAIKSLSASHRAIVMLREFEGLSYDEIAKALKISKGTVMSRLFYARTELEKKLRPYIEEGDEAGAQA